MQIITYKTTDPDAPKSALAVAYIHLGQTKKGADLGWLPVVFRAPTEDEARSRAQAHWDAAKGDPVKAADPKKRTAKDKPEAQPAPVIEEAF